MPNTPLAALSLQWYRQTPYMENIGLAPVIGGTIMTTKTWNRMSPEDQQRVRKIALETEKQLMKEVPVQDEKAVGEMSQRGLDVIEVPEEIVEEWREAAEQFTAFKREQMESTELLDKARRLRDDYRRNHGGGAGQ